LFGGVGDDLLFRMCGHQRPGCANFSALAARNAAKSESA
jgi:hypothetical protein